MYGRAVGRDHGKLTDITSNFVVSDITDNYLVLDYAQISYDGLQYSERMPLSMIMEKLLRADYKGRVSIKQSWQAKDAVKACLVMEQGNVISASVNGHKVDFTQSSFDPLFMQADISGCLAVGNNEFIYEIEYYQHEGVHFALFDPLATESVRNCLYYDMHIENAFIKGDFVLDDRFVISQRKALPPVTNALYTCGYPFFKGEVELQGKYFFDGQGARELCLDGRFAMAEVWINGARTEFALSDRRDITQCLRVGDNSIVIKLYSSLRNLFGPHHFAVEREPMGVGPFAFTMRGSWEKGISKWYTEEYNSVPFGLEKIVIVEKK